jgi:hypothetical protein
LRRENYSVEDQFLSFPGPRPFMNLIAVYLDLSEENFGTYSV